GGLVDRAIATGDEHAIKAAVAAMDAHRTFGGDVLAAGAALVEEIERSVRATGDVLAPQPITYAIRLARPDEVPRLRHIEDEAGTMSSGLGLVDEASDVSFPLDDLARLVRLGQVWVACTEDAIPVGMVIASVREGAVHVEELDVLPAHGRRGLGARLLAAACAWAARSRAGRRTVLRGEREPPRAPRQRGRARSALDREASTVQPDSTSN
ncbi:MAG: GNAT family N-acetyltransferase, partial [Anaeromyxobacteraceae bacterium]